MQKKSGIIYPLFSLLWTDDQIWFFLKAVSSVNKSDCAGFCSYNQAFCRTDRAFELNAFQQLAVRDARSRENGIVAFTRSSMRRTLFTSRPIASQRVLSSSLCGSSLPMISPPRAFRATAESTPSGAPPDPNKISTPVWSKAVLMAPATSPSLMSLILAPASRSSEMIFRVFHGLRW